MKKFLAAALVASMALSLGACSTEPNQPSSSGSNGGDAAKTTITWWAFPTFGAGEQAGVYEKEVIAAFEEANPDIKVELTTIDFTSGPEALTAAIEGGTAPDVLFDAPGRIIEYGNAGKLVKLDDMFTDEFVADVNNEALINACKGKDGAYMYPLSSAPFYMGLNKNMLEEANALQYVNLEGDRTWTTDNFVKMCEALKDAGVAQVPGIVYCGGQGGDQGTRAIINNMYGGTFTDDAHTKYTADSAENIKAIQTLYDADGINFDASIAGGDEITLFRNGTLQMAFCWNIAQQLNADNNDAGLTNDGDEIMPMAFPTASGDPKLCGGIWGFGVFDNGDEAKVKAAKTFIEFIAADPDQVKDSVLASTYFPVRASVGDIYADNAIMSEYTKFMAYLGDYYQITPGWATARTEWWNMLQRVGTGEDVATSVATFVQNANAAAAAEA